MLLKLRKNSQLTLPANICKSLHLEDGDILECEVRDGQIALTPKKLIDKRDAWFWTAEWQQGEAQAQKDIQEGNIGDFESVDDLLGHLKGD